MTHEDEQKAPALALPHGVIEALVRHSGDCIKVLDLDGHVLVWNPACEGLYGWAYDEVRGLRLPHVVPDQRLRVVMDLRAIAGSDHAVEREADAVRADGTRIRVRNVVLPVKDEEGDPAAVVSISREISFDERFERQRDHFLALLTARLSEPLAAIASNAQLLTRPEIAENVTRRQAAADTVMQRAAEVTRLVEDLALVTELRQGALSLEVAPVDLGALVMDVLGRHPEFADRMVVDLDPALPRVVVDRRRIVTVVVGLLDNALLVTPTEETVEVSVYGEDGCAIVTVADRGPAIDPLELGRLFDSFYEGPEPRAGGGGGIGLHLAAAIAEAHGGTIRVQEHAQGAKFELVLPMKPLAQGEPV